MKGVRRIHSAFNATRYASTIGLSTFRDLDMLESNANNDPDVRLNAGEGAVPPRDRTRADIPRLPLRHDEPPDVYSVPRRFDIATLLVVSFAYSVLFSGLRGLNASLGTFAFVGGLTVVVGAAQALLASGLGPRASSTLSGMVYVAIWILVLHLTNDAPGMIVALIWCIVCGGVAGYLCGAIEAGVFLVADKVRRLWFSPPD
jgi:hypothetical protein